MSAMTVADLRSEVEPWPMTASEQALWNQYLRDPDDTSYLLPIVVDVRGQDATATVRRVMPQVLDRYPVLRSSPTWDAPPRWAPGTLRPGALVDATDLGDDEPAWIAAVQDLASRPFEDLSSEPPCRYGIVAVTEDRCLLWFVVHHIATDLHGAGILLQEFRALLAGDTLPAPVPSTALSVVEAEYLTSAERADDLAFWRQEAAALPTIPPPDAAGAGIAVRTRHLEPAEADALVAAARNARRPFGSVVQAAFCLALHRLDSRDAVSVGVTCNLRHDPAVAFACGYAVNTVPVRSQLGAASVAGYLDDFVPRSRAVHRHQRLPAAEIAAARGADARSPLFDDLLVFTLDRSEDTRQRWLLDPDGPDAAAGRFRLRRVAASRGALQCRSILTVCRDAAGLGIWLEYRPDSIADPERVLDDVVTRMRLLLSDPDAPMPTTRGEES
ncbi:condensation domain-containing protein [Microbacterium lacticum]|uniref:Condensation domain-containing protein n=1 Tax=Microbacterium lacticum TaxID=33885 RepID=A0A4Y3UQJ6_9MICO|nr:condensation domain-containing protein [Microbacterium lacticum]TQM90235.1 condensation domain-containing protein [Microbacterium lacticum]GEB95165.1 hypothetical protein MLA01_13840 [Microbacterium lacticum]GGN21944.1 hypothetical protein GCM10009724_15230 [Microbacterium lacticum]